MKKGELFEKFCSEKIGQNEIPFLISSKILRSKNLGQIDLAFVKKINSKIKIEICELKYSAQPGRRQQARLLKAQNYLARVLELEVNLKIIFCQKPNDSLF